MSKSSGAAYYRRRARVMSKEQERWASLAGPVTVRKIDAPPGEIVRVEPAQRPQKRLPGEHALYVSCRLDLAEERHCFMYEVPKVDVVRRVAEVGDVNEYWRQAAVRDLERQKGKSHDDGE